MIACKAATEGNARCRNWADGEDGLCNTHRTMEVSAPLAPRPDTVLYKFSLNDNWKKRFVNLGVPVKEPDFVKREQKHVEQAEAHGRQAYRYRKVADAGVPVFGKQGLSNVSLYELLRELTEAYDVIDIHIEEKRDGQRRMSILSISFSNGTKSVSNTLAVQELMQFLSSSCWGYCHVWANPPQLDTKKIVHTVNTSHREPDQKPERILRFANGLWQEELKLQVA